MSVEKFSNTPPYPSEFDDYRLSKIRPEDPSKKVTSGFGASDSLLTPPGKYLQKFDIMLSQKLVTMSHGSYTIFTCAAEIQRAISVPLRDSALASIKKLLRVKDYVIVSFFENFFHTKIFSSFLRYLKKMRFVTFIRKLFNVKNTK